MAPTERLHGGTVQITDANRCALLEKVARHCEAYAICASRNDNALVLKDRRGTGKHVVHFVV
ncbi:MAG: hypothetical protein V7675_14945 [Hyphomonas sp.]|uniref:hypothetical protein n=1 Tax=Hyphomonas sp. TaxID=87 RepID=UPI00300164E3